MSYEPIKVVNGQSFYDIDAPPASPNTADDEFDDGAIGPTVFNPGSKLTSGAENDWGLSWVVSNSGGAGNNWCGYYLPIPSGTDWSVITKASMEVYDGTQGNQFLMGLGLFESAVTSSPTTADFAGIFMNQRMDSAVSYNQIFAAYYTDYQTFSALKAQSIIHNVEQPTSAAGAGAVLPTTMWFRIAYDSTNFRYFYSWNGLHWMYLGGEAAPVTPNQIGILTTVVGATASSVKAHFSYVRANTNSNVSDDPHGARVARVVLGP
jgi:hypothetical protein